MVELFGVDSRALYAALVALFAAERGAHVALSERNTRRALERGAVELGRDHYPVMVALHAAFLLACPLEVVFLHRPLYPPLAAAMAVLLAVAAVLRYWAIATLGGRWSTRVVCLPGAPAIRRGPYRLMRHPNYVAVVLEIAALPMLHTAWASAVLFSGANLLLLRVRVRVEEAGLRRFCDYEARFGRTST